jgi:type I restriction-modification system DNA methylase subunit
MLKSIAIGSSAGKKAGEFYTPAEVVRIYVEVCNPQEGPVMLPEKGKKEDLMFVQHMLSVLKHDGRLASVMPHGVMFRGGEEREARKYW